MTHSTMKLAVVAKRLTLVWLFALLAGRILPGAAAGAAAQRAVETVPAGSGGRAAAGFALSPASPQASPARAPGLTGLLRSILPGALPSPKALRSPQSPAPAPSLPASSIVPQARTAAVGASEALPEDAARLASELPAQPGSQEGALKRSIEEVQEALQGLPDASSPGEAAHQAGASLEESYARAGRGRLPGAAAGSVAGVRRMGSLRGPGLGRPKARPGVGAVADAGGKGPASEAPELLEEVRQAAGFIARIRGEIAKVIVGQEEMVDAVIMGLVAGEHVLIEGVPGTAKTQTARAFADATEAEFHRIQGTPDKLPSDILGAEILQEDPATGRRALQLERGPVFANIVLADEINRMMPKTQAALLEAMQERRVTIGRETLELPQPFILLATQNPLENEGVYPLPEAQLDRFMFKVLVSPSRTEEDVMEVARRHGRQQAPKAGRVMSLEDLARMRTLAERIRLSPTLERYIARLVLATRRPEDFGLSNVKEGLENGASDRAALALTKASRIRAMMQGRAFVTDEDVKAVAPMVLRHRLKLGHKAGQRTPDDYIRKILETVPVPR